MKYDKTIAWRLNHLPKKANVNVKKLLEDYEVACHLSSYNKTCPRTRHWEGKAGEIRERINRIFLKFPVATPSKA